MENSGLRVAAEYIARISLGCGVPVVLLLSYRGDLGETEHWGVPHGIVAEPLLKALRIPYHVVQHREDLRAAIKRAFRLAEAQLHPAAVLISGTCIWED
jgi:sulfopyruvate decarboxylase subunit alpha